MEKVEMNITCMESENEYLRITVGDCGLWFELGTNGDYSDICESVKISRDDISGLIVALQMYVNTGKLTEVQV